MPAAHRVTALMGKLGRRGRPWTLFQGRPRRPTRYPELHVYTSSLSSTPFKHSYPSQRQNDCPKDCPKVLESCRYHSEACSSFVSASDTSLVFPWNTHCSEAALDLSTLSHALVPIAGWSSSSRARGGDLAARTGRVVAVRQSGRIASRDLVRLARDLIQLEWVRWHPCENLAFGTGAHYD